MFVVVLLTLVTAAVGAQVGLPYCVHCGADCRPPRDTSVSAMNWETHSEADPENPETARSCVCNCGKREFEACVRGECGYGLRCLHSKHAQVNGGNICKPLCSDPGVYQATMYTSCVEDYEHDVPIVLPRPVTCSDYESPVDATRVLSDGHHDQFNFINMCYMSNANADLIGEQTGGNMWKLAVGL